MNERKQHVIEKAHQLFINKGYQSTSIQDILDYSGISKGTFYNYFSSKNELLIALIKMIYRNLEKERNEVLIGKDPADIQTFIDQIVLLMKINRKNKLFSIFEEVLFSNDEELKRFIKQWHLRSLHWVYERFLDIFGESHKPYMLDCAIMFLGILQNNFKYNNLAYDSNYSLHQVVQYSVNRIVKLVDEVTKTGEQLIQPEILETWLPSCAKGDQLFQQNLYHLVLALKKSLVHCEEKEKFTEMLDFIQDELFHSKNPRKYLIEMALISLKEENTIFDKKDMQGLEKIIYDYFSQKS